MSGFDETKLSGGSGRRVDKTTSKLLVNGSLEIWHLDLAGSLGTLGQSERWVVKNSSEIVDFAMGLSTN